jgi:hypothetical protein
MSKNSMKQTVQQSQDWRSWMISKGSLKIKKKIKPLYIIQN